MLSLDVLDSDCLISVFMYLDVDNLTNMVIVNEERYLASAQVVFKRKFRKENMILDGDSSCTTASYVNRLRFFGDAIAKLCIKVPLSHTQQLLQGIRDHCQQSLTEFTFHHADNSANTTEDDLSAMQSFFQHLDDFSHLNSLEFKHGDIQSSPSGFDRLNIRLPNVVSLKKLTIDGFGGRLDNNSSEFIRLNPQIEEFSLWTGYENLHSNYLKYISEHLRLLKMLDLRFAVYFPLDGDGGSLNFESLEKLSVVCFFNLSGNTLPFAGDTMDKLVDLHYICTTTNSQMINIVAQFKQLKRLKIGAYGLEDEHLMILAQHLKQIEYINIADLPSNDETSFSFSAEGIKEFQKKRRETSLIIAISINENNYDVNSEWISDMKEILSSAQWVVLEQVCSDTRYVIIFNV